MISVVCVYNNERLLNDYLLKSLNEQTVKFELIKIDNTSGSFESASEALNYGGKKANGKYIMFVHQDVDLSSNSWLEDTEKMLDSLPNLGIAGVAGNKDERAMTIIEHSDPPRLVGEIYIQKPTKVQTLDECLVIIPESTFTMLHFDETVCDDWHLYAVDYCLSCKKLGFDVYVMPIYIYHRSSGIPDNKNRLQVILSLGILPKGFYQTLKKLLKKHKNDYRWIYTTIGRWDTKYPLILQRICLLIKSGLINQMGNLRNMK